MLPRVGLEPTLSSTKASRGCLVAGTLISNMLVKTRDKLFSSLLVKSAYARDNIVSRLLEE